MISPPAEDVLKSLRGHRMFAVVLELAGRPLLYGFFPACNKMSALRTALMLAQLCERTNLQDVTVWPIKVMGNCQWYETYENCSRFASNLESSNNAVQLDPAKALVE